MRFPAIGTLFLNLFLLSTALPAQKLEVQSLRRQDLPEDFPYKVLELGFAVVQLKISNDQDHPMTVDAAAITVRNPGGKKIAQKQPTDITPKLMKLLQKSHSSIDVGSAPRDTSKRSEWERTEQIGSAGGSGRVSVNTAQQLLSVLGHYQFQGGLIEPGQTLEGLVYVKSKKTARKLAGGEVEVAGQTVQIP